MASASGSSGGPTGGSLKDVRDLAFVVAIFLYFAAFLYLRTLFHDLGVDVGLIEIPTFAMFVYALEPLESRVGILLLVLILLGAALTYRMRDDQSRRVAAVVMLGILFFGLQYVAVAHAHFKSDQLRRGHGRPVAFTVREPDKVKLSPWLETQRSRCEQYTSDPTSTVKADGRTVPVTCSLFFVAETKDAFFAFAHVPDGPKDPPSRGQLVELRKDHLSSWLVNVDP